MPPEQQPTRLSASNLANYLACKHLTGLDQRVWRGELEVPQWHDPELKLLKQRGIDHEKSYVSHLRATGLSVIDLSEYRGHRSLRLLLAEEDDEQQWRRQGNGKADRLRGPSPESIGGCQENNDQQWNDENECELSLGHFGLSRIRAR
jgi:hypothetical protein